MAPREMPRWPLMLALAFGVSGSGCDTYVVLRSRCPDAGVKACADAEPVGATECKDYLDCKPNEDCQRGRCAVCEEGDACDACPAGTEGRKFVSGGCVICKCLPQCTSHEACPVGSVCVAGSCSDCGLSAACPTSCDFGWRATGVFRNGCKLCECAPPNECWKDEDCGSGQVCYAGQHCDDGCTTADCCRGNVCGAKGCKPTAALNCSLVGCARGTCAADPSCKPGPCKCDLTAGTDTGWVCGGECKFACQ